MYGNIGTVTKSLRRQGPGFSSEIEIEKDASATANRTLSPGAWLLV